MFKFLIGILLFSHVASATYTSHAGKSLYTVTKTSTYTVTSNDIVIFANATGGGFTITLPDAVANSKKIYYIKKIDSSANTVTIGTTSSQTIDGSTTQSIAAQNTAMLVISDGSNWNLL